MDAKHTATPWKWWTSNSHMRLTGADGKDGGVISASIAADGIPVVNVTPDDAAFIVRACNAHDDLVTALGAVIDFIEGKPETPAPFGLVRAALAAAGAK